MLEHFRGKDFLKLSDFTAEELSFVVDTAIDLKRKRAMRETYEPLRGKTVAMVFEKPSTRTRVSFQAGVAQLGGSTFYLRPDELQTSRGEPIKDTARVIDRYCDALFIRTFGQEIVEEFARWMNNPVINALTNEAHPCQGICDLMTIKEKKGNYQGLKIAYLGYPWNVGHSLMAASGLFGMHFAAAWPVTLEIDEHQVELAQRFASQSGGSITITHDAVEAITDADVVYGMSWKVMAGTPMPDEERLQLWKPFQVNAQLMGLAKPNAIFMHCLPGYRGEEMTDDVAESPQSVLWDQGENRMHTEKAILALFIK